MIINPINRGLEGLGKNAYYLDIEQEKLEAQMSAQDSLLFIKAALIVSVFINILIGNPLGGFTALVVYFIILNYNGITVNISITKHRFIRQYQSKNGRMHSAEIVLLVLLVVEQVWHLAFFKYTQTMQNYFGLFLFSFYVPRLVLDFVFPIFNIIITEQLPTLTYVGNGLLILIHLWVAVLLYKSYNSIEETHIKQITEMVINERKIQSKLHRSVLTGLIVAAVAFNATQYPQELPIRYIGLGLILIYYTLSRTETVYNLQLVGRAGNPLKHTIIVHEREKMQVRKFIATTFHVPVVETGKQRFPQNIISEEITNIFPTGLVRNKEKALKQADIVAYIIISLLITRYTVIWFYQSQNNLLEAVITLIIIGFLFIVIIYIMHMIRKEIAKPRSTEFFLIGNTIHGYYNKSSLWLAHIDVISGLKMENKIQKKFFNYNRVIGIKFAWKTIILLMIFSFSVLIFTQWLRFGAINVIGVQILLQYYIEKATTDLRTYINANPYTLLVIITVIWISLYLVYPRIYAYALYKINLELKQIGEVSILFENKEDLLAAYHEIAKLQFTKVTNKRDYNIGRPSAFVLNIKVTATDLTDQIISIGDKSIPHFLTFDEENTAKIRLLTSARTGVPQLLIKEWITHQQENSKSILLDLSLAKKQKIEVKLTATLILEIEICKILS